MNASPLRRAIQFWKPVADQRVLEGLAMYRAPGEPLLPGINVLRCDALPAPYRVEEGACRYSLFAAVHPIADVPDSARVVARIATPEGDPFSYVLWYPDERAVVIPFDPDAAVEALQLERYVPISQRTVLPTPILGAYYAFKPLIPAGMKLRLRRRMARAALANDSFLSWPSDLSLDLLQRLMLRVMLLAMQSESIRFLWFWPNGHPWAAVLTHDVESADGLTNVPHVMAVETDHGLRSSFNLVAHDYAQSGSLLCEIRDAGFEIGVHGYRHDGAMFASWAHFLERTVAVNECARRWGAVGFRSPATYRNLEWMHLLGVEYDSSLSDTAPLEPQPGGCASLFPFIVGDLTEMPMTLPQDHTLFGLLGYTDSDVWTAKLAQIERANGMACMLTHPDPGPGYIGRAENEQHYKDVLSIIGRSDAWTPLPRELVRWWRVRAAADAGRSHPEGATFGIARLDAEGRLGISRPGGAST